jgi:chromosome segregation ATPase
MKREFLKAFGLEDETIDKILDEHSRGIGAEKAKLETMSAAKADLEAQITQRDKDLAELKKAAKGSDELEKQLTALQEAAKAEKASYEAKIMSAAIKAELKGKVHDEQIVSGLIDSTKLKLDDAGNVIDGLAAQIEQLSKDKSFLFVQQQEQQGTKSPSGFKPAESSSGTPPAPGQTKSLSEAVAAALGGNNS